MEEIGKKGIIYICMYNSRLRYCFYVKSYIKYKYIMYICICVDKVKCMSDVKDCGYNFFILIISDFYVYICTYVRMYFFVVVFFDTSLNGYNI